MYYEINVALNKKHLFATDRRSITNKIDLKRVYKIFKNKFPEDEGYNISITYYETIGKPIDTKDLIEDDVL